jgi:tRNA(adenine34) deaminase
MDDLAYLREAIQLAKEAEHNGNLPVGALIVLDGEIITRGKNAIWEPVLDLTHHAEMEALWSLPPDLRIRCREMTLYTTLEPCMMCAGAIILHKVSRLVFGAVDPGGGVSSCFDVLPPYFKRMYSRIQWVGPALPAECDPLYLRLQEIRACRNSGGD